MSNAQTVVRGLEGVVVATSAISKVYGDEGRLVYRGYDAVELAEAASYEEVSYLLWHGRPPRASELADLTQRLADARSLPEPVTSMLAGLPRGTHPMVALRTGVSHLAAFDPDVESTEPAAMLRVAERLLAQTPTLVAAFERLRSGASVVDPDPALGHAANCLWMLTGRRPTPEHVRALEAYLVLVADHGFTSSTFAARVTASTQSDMVSAIVAAIATLKGRLHGGANQKVMEMLDAIGTPEAAQEWLQAAVSRRERIMGIGHRVYRRPDPRAEVLARIGAGLAQTGEGRIQAVAESVASAAVAHFEARRPELRLYPNVDLFSAPVLHALGIATDQFTAFFAIGRMAGWTAHVLEQASDNRLIRPRAEYIGPTGKAWQSLEER